MYENVLKFPKGTDHLEYFEKNPHSDKLPDKELALYELFNKSSHRRKAASKKIEFELVRQLLEPGLSDLDKEILSLPDVLQEEIKNGGDKDYLDALAHLRDCFYNYFSTPIDKSVLPDIQWIDYEFATKHHLAQKALADLIDNLFYDAGKDNLVKKLQSAKAFGNERKDFYLWNTSPYNWDDMSYQSRTIDWNGLPFNFNVLETLSDKFLQRLLPSKWSMPTNLIKDQYTALGNFTINALPEGYVEPKGNGRHEVCVNKMYYFINDSFNFEGYEPLGKWRVNKKSANNKEEESTSFLSNAVFRHFTRHGYGREFPVLSRLHEVEDFKSSCWEYHLAK